MPELAFKPIFWTARLFEANPYPVAVNGSIWSLPVEVFTYSVIGILLSILLKLKQSTAKILNILLVCFGLFVVARWQMQGTVNHLIFWGTDWLASLELIMYMLIGSLYETADLKKYCNIYAAALSLLVALCIKTQYGQLLALLVLPYFTLSFALGDWRCPVDPFEKLNISYGVFLWHFPIAQTFAYLLIVQRSIEISPNLMFVLCMIASVLMAGISRFLIEIPVEGFLKKKLLRKTS